LRLLLDTHIWIWSVANRSSLSPRIAQELVDPNNECWISPVSVWEALLLESKGKIAASPGLDWVPAATAPFREAPFTFEIAAMSVQLPWSNQDPVDRFIAATAFVLGLTLVTADRRLLELGMISTLTNR
jgi:PIN domain nuclease of toxin-antitoxin system